MAEPGDSDIFDDEGRKWLRGLRWEEIDDALMLRHAASTGRKNIEMDLKDAPMVMEELERLGISTLSSAGPVIVSEDTDLPYDAHDFRRLWREIATAAGVPPTVFNMDSSRSAATDTREIEKDRPAD